MTREIVYPRREGLTIQQDFEAFHEANPWIYEELARMARVMHKNGRTHLGIKMFVEVIRWNYYQRTIGSDDSFRINDHYSSRYVRLLVENEPYLAEMFRLRRLRSA